MTPPGHPSHRARQAEALAALILELSPSLAARLLCRDRGTIHRRGADLSAWAEDRDALIVAVLRSDEATPDAREAACLLREAVRANLYGDEAPAVGSPVAVAAGAMQAIQRIAVLTGQIAADRADGRTLPAEAKAERRLIKQALDTLKKYDADLAAVERGA